MKRPKRIKYSTKIKPSRYRLSTDEFIRLIENSQGDFREFLIMTSYTGLHSRTIIKLNREMFNNRENGFQFNDDVIMGNKFISVKSLALEIIQSKNISSYGTLLFMDGNRKWSLPNIMRNFKNLCVKSGLPYGAKHGFILSDMRRFFSITGVTNLSLDISL